jgi:hypothetical protein
MACSAISTYSNKVLLKKMTRERVPPKCLYTYNVPDAMKFHWKHFSFPYSKTKMEALTSRGNTYKVGVIW